MLFKMLYVCIFTKTTHSRHTNYAFVLVIILPEMELVYSGNLTWRCESPRAKLLLLVSSCVSRSCVQCLCHFND